MKVESDENYHPSRYYWDGKAIDYHSGREIQEFASRLMKYASGKVSFNNIGDLVAGMPVSGMKSEKLKRYADTLQNYGELVADCESCGYGKVYSLWVSLHSPTIWKGLRATFDFQMTLPESGYMEPQKFVKKPEGKK